MKTHFWLFDCGRRMTLKRTPRQRGLNVSITVEPTCHCLLDHTKLTVGVNNLFDHDPPASNDNFPRYIYDTSRRFIYASLTRTF